MALSGISREAEGFPLSLNDPFISPLDFGDAEDIDPLASCTRPRGLGDRDFDFLLGISECCVGVVALSNCSSWNSQERSVLIDKEPLWRLACCERSTSSWPVSVVLPRTLTSCTGSTDCEEDAAKEVGTEEKCEGKVSPIKRDVAEGSRFPLPPREPQL